MPVDWGEVGYSPGFCITAKECRDLGIKIPEMIPDCAWVPRGSYSINPSSVNVVNEADNSIKIGLSIYFNEPFRWTEGIFYFSPSPELIEKLGLKEVGEVDGSAI